MHAGLPEQFRRLGVRLGESVSQSGIGDLEEHINITEDLIFSIDRNSSCVRAFISENSLNVVRSHLELFACAKHTLCFHDDWQFVLSPRVSWRHHPMKISAVSHHVHRGQLPHVSPVPGKLKLFCVCSFAF